MRSTLSIMTLVFSATSISGEPFTNLTGDYLGQHLPGKTPMVFARGIVSTPELEHSAPHFTMDGNRVYWSTGRKSKIKSKNTRRTLMMKRIRNRWTQPMVVQEFPTISPDGKRYYFSTDPLPVGAGMVIKKQDRDGFPAAYIHLLAKYPELKYTRLLSMARNGNIYFMGYLEGVYNGFGIYRAQRTKDGYAKPEPLPAAINKPGMLNWTTYISPDETFLIFSSNRKEPENDWGDLYISHYLKDGTWTEPENLGDSVNSPEQERFPMLSPDGKFLFFTRPTPNYDQDVYWVDARTIPALTEKSSTGSPGIEGK